MIRKTDLNVKILVSPGYGAGWSTWAFDANDEQIRFMLTFPPLIEAIEADEHVGVKAEYVNFDDYQRDDGSFDALAYHRAQCVEGSALDQFVIAWFERWSNGNDIPHLQGAEDLIVQTVSRPFRIREHDGSESVEYYNPNRYIDPASL